MCINNSKVKAKVHNFSTIIIMHVYPFNLTVQYTRYRALSLPMNFSQVMLVPNVLPIATVQNVQFSYFCFPPQTQMPLIRKRTIVEILQQKLIGV